MSDIPIFLEWIRNRSSAQPDTPRGNTISTYLSRIGARVAAQGLTCEPPLTDEEKRITRLLYLKMKREHSTHTVLA